ncbi:MAG: hypothetical protein R3A13_12455 [Bdellovibrionota bacterium]
MNLAILCSTLLIIFSALGTLTLAMLKAGAAPAPSWYLSIYSGLTAIYLFVVWRYKDEHSHNKLLALMLGAVAARIIFCFAPTILDTELWRYLWDGALMRQNLSPYLHSPAQAASLDIFSLNQELITNSQNVSQHPPYAQYLFSVFGVSEFVWKLFIVACDIANILLLTRILEMLGKAPGRILFYAYLPLTLIEYGGSGRLEAVFVLSILSFIYFSLTRPDENRWIKLSFFAASSILIKTVAIIPTIFFLIKRNIFQSSEKRKIWILILIIYSFICLPFLDLGLLNILHDFNFFAKPSANHSLQHFTEWILGTSASTLSGVIAFSIFILLILYLAVKEPSWIKASMYTLALISLLGTSFQPWHVLWFAAFICIFDSKALLYLVLTAPIFYSTTINGETISVWLKTFIFLPTYILLTYELLKQTQEIQVKD